MNIIKSLKVSWQNDSFYMQTTSKNAESVFVSGTVGCLAGRITGFISPRDGAIYLIANAVSDIFINFMENRFAKEPFMSDEDKDLEEGLRGIIKIVLIFCLSRRSCSLLRMRGLENLGLNKANMKFVGVVIAINFVIEKAFKALFPSPEPGETS